MNSSKYSSKDGVFGSTWAILPRFGSTTSAEMLTTASETSAARSASDSGPLAKAGTRAKEKENSAAARAVFSASRFKGCLLGAVWGSRDKRGARIPQSSGVLHRSRGD